MYLFGKALAAQRLTKNGLLPAESSAFKTNMSIKTQRREQKPASCLLPPSSVQFLSAPPAELAVLRISFGAERAIDDRRDAFQ